MDTNSLSDFAAKRVEKLKMDLGIQVGDITDARAELLPFENVWIIQGWSMFKAANIQRVWWHDEAR